MLEHGKYKNNMVRFFLGILFLFIPFGYIGPALSSQSASAELVPANVVTDSLKGYSKKEIKLIEEDAKNIKSLCFRNITPATGSPVYIGTAGGPGASKTTILETYLQDKPNYVYLNPNQRALNFMINTYGQEFTNYKFSQTPDRQKLSHDAYNKWRGASNFITFSLLNEAFANKYNIAHGTTATSPHIARFYSKLKNNSYRIILLLAYSTNENRINAATHRSEKQNFCQADPDDVAKKGKMFPKRFKDYFHYADEIHLYWTDKFNEGSTHAASLVRGSAIKIHDTAAMEKFTQQYEHERETLNREDAGPLEDLIKGFK